MNQPTQSETLNRTLSRIAVESSERVRKGRICCTATSEHIRSSRQAISRSLDVLARTYAKIIV